MLHCTIQTTSDLNTQILHTCKIYETNMLTLKYCGCTIGTKVTIHVNTFGDNCTLVITKCVVLVLHLKIVKHDYEVAFLNTPCLCT